jgi:hypothetical protein
LACDYRYGVLWIDRRAEVGNWQDPTGVNRLQPPAGSRLAETWDHVGPVGMDFVSTPFSDALLYVQDQDRVAIDFSALPPASCATPVTLSVRGLAFKHCLGLLLEQAGCQATLRGETIVVGSR